MGQWFKIKGSRGAPAADFGVVVLVGTDGRVRAGDVRDGVRERAQLGFDALDWVPDLSTDDGDDENKGGKKEISTKLIVECEDVTRLELLFNELQERGFKCSLE